MAYRLQIDTMHVECDTASEAEALAAAHAGPTECGGDVEPSTDGMPVVHIGDVEVRLVRCTVCGHKAYLSPEYSRCQRMVRKSPQAHPVGGA